jgi:excisionase family DNA binding protein
MASQSDDKEPISAPSAPMPAAPEELHELLTVEDVAALLKVNRSWVYEHTRVRSTSRSERLPFIKIGKYTRFDAQAVREFLRRRSKIA